ncbi:MAG: hypothetical protein RJA70_2249 [Pseudomonadota bacterium]|jgi:hypothetical protein
MKHSTIKLFRVVAPLALGATLATTACVGSKDPKKEPTTSAKNYVTTEVPTDITRVDINFGDKVTLLGYKMAALGTVKPGEKVKFTLYWKTEKPLGESGWHLFTHILSEKNKKLLNIDNVGPLRDNGTKAGQAHPPGEWEVGKIYVDEQSFRVPKQTRGSSISLVTGIWKGKSRLTVKSGAQSGSDRAVIATLTVSGGAPAEVVAAKVPEVRVDKLEKGQSVKIDGKLDDSAWVTAPSTGAFVNVSSGAPDKGASVQGKARILWDDKHVYLGFEVADEDVIGGFEKGAKDPHLWTKDCVEIMLDPDGDGDNKDYYEIQVNPQNLVFDSQFDDYNSPKAGENGPFGHQEWSAQLKSAVVVDGTLDKPGDKDGGYTAELQIPWASFDKAKQLPPKPGDTWRINLYAMQNNGGVAWSPILKQGNFHKAARFGRILWANKEWVGPSTASLEPAVAPAASAPSGTGAMSTVSRLAKKLAKAVPAASSVSEPSPSSGAP